MKIQSVKSSSGIEGWLVQEHSVPLLALRFVFEGGNAQDPAGEEGLANFLTAMMDEGAGDLNHAKFQERMEELAFRMGFEDARDALYGSFETLTANRDASLEMLRLALNKPRFDADAVERVKKQLLASLAFAAKKPDRIASKAWSAAAFPDHPYGRPAEGTPESIATITRDDLEGFRKRTFARDTLRVVAVGDITAEQLKAILDKLFGDLPAKAELIPVAATKPSAAEKLKVIEMDVPQSVVQFGMNGIARKDNDFMAGFILNQILGGGGFASRLTEEVREKRGLAYSVYSYLQPYRHVAIFGGGVATKNEEVAQSIDVIRGELKRMADGGPTEAEFANAKSYLTGSFALRFDTNAKIANQLLWMLQEEMGIDYVEKRNGLVDAVTIEDVKRVAKRLLLVDDMIITVVGKPKGLGQRI
jgi:zinc protease